MTVTWKPKNIHPIPAKIVINRAVINVISTLFVFVASDFVAISLIVKKIAEIISTIDKAPPM